MPLPTDYKTNMRSGIRFFCLGTLLIAAAIAPRGLMAQNAVMSGFVSDDSDGQALEGVNVVLTGVDGSRRGDASNRDGLYMITGIVPGRYALTVSFVGYATLTDTLDFRADQRVTRPIRLRPARSELDEVVVQSERTEGAARVTAGLQVVRPTEIQLVPTPDVSGDLVSYLTALPGVVSSGDRGGQLFIRGGEPTQNMVMLDGMVLYQPFHLVGFYSAFPAEIINRADVYAGGYGARFGERISSVIDVWTRNGNMRRIAGSAAVSPFLSSMTLEGPLWPNKISFLFSGRESMVEDFASRVIGQDLPYRFGDAFGKIQIESSSKSRISLTGLHTHDAGTLVEGNTEVPREEVDWTNTAYGVRYLILPNVLPVALDTKVNYSRLESNLDQGTEINRNSMIQNIRIAIDANFMGERVNADAGMEVVLLTLDSRLNGMFQNVSDSRVTLTHVAQYLELEMKLGGGVLLRPGIRLQFYQIQTDPLLEPRLRVIWNRGIHQFSAAGGVYRQEIVGLNDRRDAASIFTAWSHIPQYMQWEHDITQGRLPRAVHGIVGYRATPTRWLDLSVEAYYKDLKNLFVAEWTAFPRFTTNLQPATGIVRGLDLRAEVRRGPFFGYVSYGYSNTRYKAEMERLRLWYGTESMHYRPAHDRRHQVNALVNLRIAGFDLSTRWEFGSGLPYSQAVGFDGFSMISEVRPAIKHQGSRRVIYERPFNGELPTYHRLDVSVERTFDFGRFSTTIMGSLINAYDRRNLYYLDVFTLQRADQLPFVPSLGLRVAVD